jgi:hypothetical protein
MKNSIYKKRFCIKTWMTMSLLVFSLNAWSKAEDERAPVKALPIQEVNSKLAEYSSLIQLAGETVTTAKDMLTSVDAAISESPQSTSNTAWHYIWRVRMIAVHSQVTRLKSRIWSGFDPALKTLIESAIDGIIAECGRPSSGDYNYWNEQITRFRQFAHQTSATLNTASELIVRKAEVVREEVVGLMRKVLENPEGLPDTVRSLYAEQIVALKGVEAAYALKRDELDAEHQKRKTQLEREIQEQRAKLDRDAGEKSAKLSADYETKSTQLEAEFKQSSAKYATDTAALLAAHTAAADKLAEIRGQTEAYLQSAQMAQKNLTATEEAIRKLLNDLKPQRVRGSVLIQSDVSHWYRQTIESIVTRLLAALREYSDPDLWDQFKPSFEVKVTASLSDKKGDLKTGPGSFSIKFLLDRESFQLPTQTFPIEFGENTPYTDRTDSAGLLGAAAAIAPELSRILQSATTEGWQAVALKAVELCESHLLAIRETIPQRPVEK